jgi:hypothetical protein
MITVSGDGLGGQRLDSVRPDERLHMLDIAELRFFGAGTGPHQALGLAPCLLSVANRSLSKISR